MQKKSTKKNQKKCVDVIMSIASVAVLIILAVLNPGLMMAAATTQLPHGGAIGIDEASSVTRTKEDAERLLLDDIEEKVQVIRPYGVVLDTISRHGDVKTADAQTVRHYAIDVLEMTVTTTAAVTATNNPQIAIATSDDQIIARDQTLLVEGVQGYMNDGTTIDPSNELQLWVVNRDTNGNPIVRPINGTKVTPTSQMGFPAIPVGSRILRMGRAGTESQYATDAYSGIPTDFPQYLQKFMAQIEETTLHKIREKEVKWTFSDQEEEAIYDMKRTMNMSFWRGRPNVIKSTNWRTEKAEEVYFTGGVWNMAGKEFSFSGLPISHNNIVSMMKTAFVGNESQSAKMFIMGSDLLEEFEQVDYIKHQLAGLRKASYGVEFTQVVSKFGTLNVVHDQTFNDMGWNDRGFILDPQFLRKWTYGWKTETFDLRTSMQRDSDARLLMEICGLVLRNPEAHMRVIR